MFNFSWIGKADGLNHNFCHISQNDAVSRGIAYNCVNAMLFIKAFLYLVMSYN